jgi:putative endonuclease
MDNKKKGNAGEQKACEYLKNCGYQILEQNFRCKVGEVDIIARDGDYLVFAEVKYRKSMSLGMPQEAVDFKKQKKISATAGYYMMIKNMRENVSIRFDVVSVLGDEVTVIKNAFPYCFG